MRLRIAADTRLLALHHASSPPRYFLAPPVWLIPWPAFTRRSGDCVESDDMDTSELVTVAVQGADSGEVASCQSPHVNDTATTETLVTTDPSSATSLPVHFDVRDGNGRIDRIPVVLHNPLEVFMSAYCAAKGVPMSRVRFLLDGDLLLPTDTGEELGLVSGDILDSIDNEEVKTRSGMKILWT